jgi:demethylmenaquinone methyltransferase/2-methoxy-6-polyprenyl-1,4-benzoquinol methylase
MSVSAEGVSPTPGAMDRAEEVRAMFDQIAPTYDRANRILSLGLDQSWRRGAIKLLGEKGQGDVLDLCAGTLDLTEMLLKKGAKSIVAVDFSGQMLRVGQAKLKDSDPVKCIVADARVLPLEDSSVDAILCAFGLRNVPEVEKAIAECARVCALADVWWFWISSSQPPGSPVFSRALTTDLWCLWSVAGSRVSKRPTAIWPVPLMPL